jgi:hypothetical protein
MGTTSFPETPLNADLQRVIINLNMIAEELDQVFSNIDTKNIREIAGWLASRYKLQSKDGDVGFNTQDTAADDIRIWAGDAMNGIPKFKVTKAGKLTAVQAAFLSALGFPRITLNESEDALLKASLDADHYIYITPDYVGGTPALVWQDPASSVQMFIAPNGTGDFILNPTQKIRITSSSNDVHLECATGYRISVNSWSVLHNRFNNISLQTELNNLQSQINSLSSRVFALESAGP